MPPKNATRWTSKATEVFLDLCLESKNSGSTKFDWDTIQRRLNASTGMEFDKKALINYYSDCRLKFKAWHELKTKWTGLGWDPCTGCPEVDPNDEKWKAFVKFHKGKPASFLKFPLPYEQKMYQLYGGSFATGQRAWSSNSMGVDLFGKQNVVECEEGSGDSEEGDFEVQKKNYDSDAHCSRSPNRTNTSSGKKRKSSGGGQSSSKRSVTQDLEFCMDVLKKNIQLQTQEHSNPPRSLYDRLISTLHEIPEITAYGKAFVIDCLDYLSEPEKNGELWLALPDNEYRLLFLKKKIPFPDDVYHPQFVDDNIV